VTARGVEHAATVAAQICEAAEHRDTYRQRTWIPLVDHNNHQIDLINRKAQLRQLTVPYLRRLPTCTGVPLQPWPSQVLLRQNVSADVATGGHRPAPGGAGLLGKVPGRHLRPLRMSSQRHPPKGTTPAHWWCLPDLTNGLPKDKTYGQVLRFSPRAPLHVSEFYCRE
jgi:hypothetical protein